MAAMMNELLARVYSAKGEAIELNTAKNGIRATLDALYRVDGAKQDTTAINAAHAKMTAIEDQIIAAEKKHLELEREHARLSAARQREADAAVPRYTANGERIEPRSARRSSTGRRYAEMFGGAPSASTHFRTSGEFFQALTAGQYHPGLTLAASSLRESEGSAGGYLVPEELTAESFDRSLESEVVRPRCRVYGMAGDTRKVAGLLPTAAAAPLARTGSLQRGSAKAAPSGPSRQCSAWWS
jgi:HK97 family phage major capsid protein